MENIIDSILIDWRKYNIHWQEEEEEEEDLESQDEGVMILPNDPDKPKRAKLLQFHENQRPGWKWRQKK